MEKKNILIGISGGIAAYKITYLIRHYKKNNYNVKVIMTENSLNFISKVTVETLSENKVYVDSFEMDFTDKKDGFIPHIKLADFADLFILAPATANVLGKIANGIADDLLTSTTIALKKDIPKLIFPAMNVKMLENSFTQKNISNLKKEGYKVFQTDEGELACGVIAKGRLPEPETIYNLTKRFLIPQKLKGKKILVTSGATLEKIDPVRYISNHSSGKMGVSIAEKCYESGAEVDIVSGKYSIDSYLDSQIFVSSTEDMWEKVKKLFGKKKYDYVVMAAAVSDYSVNDYKKEKIKKNNETLTLKLNKNIDIIKSINDNFKTKIIGFAAETSDLKENALKKLNEKKMYMIVANDITKKDTGFRSESNECIIFKGSKKYETGKKKKTEIAKKIIELME